MSILRSCRLLAGALLLCCAEPAAAQNPAAGDATLPAPAGNAQTLPAPAAAQRRQFHTHFSFRNTDIAKLLRRLERFGLKVPIEISGKATTRVDVTVPIRELFRGSDYRVSATIDSDRLLIAGQDLRAVHAQISYGDGVLELADFRFELAPQGDQAAPSGQIAGSGQMQLIPRGNLRLNLRMQDVLVDRLVASLPSLQGASGHIHGNLSATAPVTDLKTPTAWRIEGQAAVSRLAIPGAPPLEAQAQFQLHDGRLDITRLHASSGDALLDGTGQVQAVAPYAFQTSLVLSLPRLQTWQPWLAKFVTLPWTPQGQARLSAQASGTLAPMQLRTAAGRIQAGELALGPMSIDRLQGDLATDGKNVALRNLQIGLYGGAINGSLALPLASTGQLAMEFAWSGIQIGKIAAAVGLPVPVTGLAAGRISAQVPLARLREVPAWSASGSIALSAVQVYAWTSNQTAAAFQLAAGRLVVSNLAGDLDGGRATGSLSLEFAAPYRSTVNLELVNGDLSRFNSLPGRLHPPLNVAGRYSVRTSLQGSLQPLEVQAAGGFLAQGARLGPIAVDRVSFVYRGSQDALRVEDFQASLFGGQAAGSAALSLAPTAPPGEAALRWQELDLAALAPLAPQLSVGVRGRTTGSVQLRTPAGRPTAWADWTAEGHAQIAGLGLGPYDLGQFAADFGLREQRLQAARIELTGPMGTMHISAQVGLSAPMDYTAHLQITKANLAVLAALAQPARPGQPGSTIAGQLAGLVDVQGTLEPLTVTGKASVAATDVVADRLKIERATLAARFDRRRVELTTAEADLYEGRASASGTVNLDDTSRLQAKLQGVNLARLASSLGYAPGHLAAVADGSLNLEIARGQLPHPDAWQAHAEIKIPEIKSGKAYLGTLSAKADYRQGDLSYQASGGLLGGNVNAQGELKTATGKQPFALGTGKWQLAGAQLDQLAALADRPALLPLSGTLSVAANVHAPREGESTIGSGKWQLADVHWNNQVILSRLGGGIRITPKRVDFVDTQGNLAGGTVLLASRIDLAQPRASAFSFELIDAQLSRLSALAGPRIATQGTLDLALRGNLARPWQIYGTAVVSDATLAGVRLSDARFSLAAEFDPLTMTGQAEVSQAAATLAGGRATGKLKVDFRGQLSIQASASFASVDLRTISSQLSSVGKMVAGKVSGNIAASGQNVRSLDDLSGTVHARFSRTQAMSLPLLSSVGPFLSGGASSATVFDDGRFVGTFSKGVLRVKKFTLVSDSLQLYVDGTITRTLRLNLNVTARTNQEGTTGLLSTALAIAIPLAGPTPVGLLLEANRLLANQTINLVVGGTLSHPSVSVQAAPLLAEEAVRFFLLQVPGSAAVP
jgi:hypothetical protein